MRHATFLLLIPLAACDVLEELVGLGDKGDTGIPTTADDTAWGEGTVVGTGNGAARIEGWDAQCLDPETYRAEPFVSGATNGVAILDIWETGAPDDVAWNEEHDVVDAFVELRVVESPHDVGDDGGGYGTTLFGCGADEQFARDEVTLAYALRVYDPDGNFADCVQFGYLADRISAGTYTTNGGVPSNPAELSSCRTMY